MARRLKAVDAAALDADELRALDGPVLGEPDPQTGRLVLSPKRTQPTAEAYVGEFHEHRDGRTLHAYHGTLLEWRDNRYAEIEDATVRHRLQPWLHKALRVKVDPKSGVTSLIDFESNPHTVNQALESIRNHVHLPDGIEPPRWLDGRTDPPARELIPCRTVNLHVRSGRVFPGTPALFAMNALDFDYDARAPRPERWYGFLKQVFEDDTESITLLGDWFGYAITPDTSLQKILLLVGPKRAGKGTIGRVLRHLVGAGNVANPTTSSLAGPFGLQPLIGKSLAIVSDARFTGESTPIVIERLLNISGEDALTIDRKFLASITMKLPTRFVFLTNELPRLSDASTAIASRFLVLRLTKSFYDNEETTLMNTLLGELPGILLWAIDGLRRLRTRGKFLQPKSAEEAIRDLEDLASPVGAFVREHCIIGPGHRVDVENLYRAWRHWCDQDGRSSAGTKQNFGKGLSAAAPGVKRRRGSDQEPFYEGIGLKGVP